MRYFLLITLIFIGLAAPLAAQESTQTVSLAGGQLTFDLPADWIYASEETGAVFAPDQHSIDLLGEAIGRIFSQIITTLETGGAQPTPTPTPAEPFAAGLVNLFSRSEAETLGFLPENMLADPENNAVAIEIKGRPAVQVPTDLGDTSPYQSDGAMIVIDYDTHILLWMSVYVGDEDLSPVFDAILQSVEMLGKPSDAELPAVLDTAPATLPNLTLVSMESAREIGGNVQTMILSPDAAHLAWLDREGMCLYTFADSTQTCTPTPETFDAPPNLMHWSPDGSYIAFYESVFLNAVESDIWLFEVATQTFINRTDDHIVGGFAFNVEGAVPLDYTPIWVGETLYFFRTLREGNANSTALYRLPDLLEGEPELVVDFSALIDEPFIGYEMPTDALAGTVSVSPDGTWLAFLMRAQDRDNQEIWLINLRDGTVQILVDKQAFQGVGMPAWVEGQEFSLNGIDWLSDQSGLVISSENFSRAGAPLTLYHLDLTTLEVAPLVDFSDIPSEAEMFIEDENGLTPLQRIPRMSIMLPHQSAALTFNPALEMMSVFTVIPGSASVQIVLEPLADFGPTPITIGQNGTLIRVLFAANIITFEMKP